MALAEAPVRLLDIAEIEQHVFTRWDITGHQLTRHLLNKELTGTPEVVLDHLTFPAGFIHHMHRHPHADIILIPCSGSVQFVADSGEPVEVSPGHVLVIPRGNWHEVRNVCAVDCQVLHLYSGVGSVDDIGYEAYNNRGGAARSLRPTRGSSACT
jgi:quercetin dioxygenase-like cupin family protein